jgi:predicted restriction endonuclease
MYSNALKRFRCYKFYNTDLGIQEAAAESLVKQDASLTETEKEVIVKARRGQGKFRDELIQKYDHKCIMTEISINQVLIASHIKPWSVCNNDERIDVNNGLLLSATYDRLFDSGLITFDINGKIKISSMISKDNANKLSLSYGKKYNIKYNPQMYKYIQYHNDVIFIS